MASNTTKKGAAKTAKPAAQASEVKAEPVKKEAAKPVVPVDVDPNQIIIVKNGFQGKLVYKSSRTQETYRWESFGDEQEIELRELRNAKSSAKKFFINNWFMFDEDNAWVIDYLGLNQYYRYALSIEDFDDIFTKKPNEIKNIIQNLSDGQKKSVSYRARVLIGEKKIDSLQAISALEEALGVELVEK